MKTGVLGFLDDAHATAAELWSELACSGIPLGLSGSS
jgi:hypothetical protein